MANTLVVTSDRFLESRGRRNLKKKLETLVQIGSLVKTGTVPITL